MNGVRRFLAGGTTSPSQPPSPPTATAPLVISGKPSWPPSSSPPESPSQSPRDSANINTTALFLQKDKRSSSTSTGDDDSAASSRVRNGFGSPTHSQSSYMPSSPIAGPSSPRIPLPQRVSQLSRRSIGRSGSQSNRSSSMLDTRDDLLISLLASEAIVDSRGYDILSAEEVDELKKEHQVLSSRMVAMTKKLSLETKIRDAAASLSKANSTYKNLSKQTNEQLDVANHKVDLAQRELWRVSERAHDIQRKLLEHRAGVLSHSVHNMENNASGPSTSGYSTPARSSQMSPTPFSPTQSSTTSMQSGVSKTRFEGAHFFAGHSGAVLPQTPRISSTSEVSALEEKLRAATAALETANELQAEMTRELSLLQLEKAEMETSMGMELQSAEDTISMLEQELAGMEELRAQVQDLMGEREVWVREREELEERRKEVDSLNHRLEALEGQSGEAAAVGAILAKVQTESRIQIEKKDQELEEMRVMWEADRTAWDFEKSAMIDSKDNANQESKAQLEEYFEVLHGLVQAHGIPLDSQERTFPVLVSSIGKHLEELRLDQDGHAQAQAEWAAARTKLEESLRTHSSELDGLAVEIEQAQRERDEAKAQVNSLEAQLMDQEARIQTLASHPTQPPVQYTGDASELVAILQPLWNILPSPEARANGLGMRNFRTGSPTNSPKVSRNGSSLSEMDVRSLKILYDPKGVPMAGISGTFTIEGFVARVQALMTDDRALIARLIRFAQAHDLLKKNAERAQKLAQDSNAALETYQKQVKTLEDRNTALMSKHALLQDEIEELQDAVDRITSEKLEVEALAAEQAETCRQLTDANNSLSARALTLAEEAASATDGLRKQLESQLAACNASLAKALEDLEATRSSQQSQQMALLEELNTVQTENTTLRAQLRKR